MRVHRRPAFGRAFAILVVLLVVVIVFMFATTAADTPAVRVAEPSAAPPWPAGELPPEWAWKRDAVRFDHMFRDGTAAGGPDWIRGSGARR